MHYLARNSTTWGKSSHHETALYSKALKWSDAVFFTQVVCLVKTNLWMWDIPAVTQLTSTDKLGLWSLSCFYISMNLIYLNKKPETSVGHWTDTSTTIFNEPCKSKYTRSKSSPCNHVCPRWHHHSVRPLALFHCGGDDMSVSSQVQRWLKTFYLSKGEVERVFAKSRGLWFHWSVTVYTHTIKTWSSTPREQRGQ